MKETEGSEEYQPWIEMAGIKRPTKDICRAAFPFVGFYDMKDEDIDKAIKFFAEDFKRLMGVPMKTFSNAFADNRTVKAMRKYGVKNLWGFNWNYFCEGINNKGSAPGPFYMSDINHNAPAPNKTYPIGVHWGAASHLIQYETDKQCRAGGAGHCLNSLELTNRSYGLDRIDFHKKVIREYAENAKWNPIVHIPLQIEAVWIDEGPIPPIFGEKAVYPSFNRGNSESYFTELEESMRVGAKGVTISDLCDYMRENVPTDHKYIFFSEDIAPDLRHKGKDANWDTFVVYKDQKHQYWFLKDRKLNYIKKYSYDPIVPETSEEYPYENEPDVALKSKEMLNPTAGIKVTDSGATYEINDFILSAKDDCKDYATIIWQANMPEYVKDVETGGFVKGYVSVKEKNALILFGDLKQGVNECIFKASLPKDMVKIVRRELVGSRYEIWIENKGPESEMFWLETQIDPQLSLGAYWWNGEYNHSLFKYGWNDYNQKEGKFMIRVYYPITFKLREGLNRLSIEVF